MFSEEQVKAYKSIKAPDELYERVLTACETPVKKKNNIYKFSSLAACLAVFIAVAIVFGAAGFSGGTTVNINGSALSASPIALPVSAAEASARTVSGIQLEADVEKNSDIYTSDGNVYIYDTETDEELYGNITAEKVTLVWDIIPENTEKTYVLTIENSRGATEVTLLFDETAGWQICCIEK